MSLARRALIVACAALTLGAARHPREPIAESPETLAVRVGGVWQVWWRRADAPTEWRAADRRVLGAVEWRNVGGGLEWGTLHLAGTGEARRTAVVVARLDPVRYRLVLQLNRDSTGSHRPWSIADADSTAALAINAGQFTVLGPWGWLVRGGHESRVPGTGPLSSALVVDELGGVRFVPASAIEEARRRGGIAEAFQSYPTLLVGDGDVVTALQQPNQGVSLTHRDSRLAVGTTRDGRLMVALTRFDGLGGALGEIPLGPTVPEMAAIMGALGSRHAMLLDGGISAQMMIRDDDGVRHSWRGLRRVPLSLQMIPRTFP